MSSPARSKETLRCLIGLGRIGSEVARRAAGFRMHVIAFDPYLGREAAERDKARA